MIPSLILLTSGIILPTEFGVIVIHQKRRGISDSTGCTNRCRDRLWDRLMLYWDNGLCRRNIRDMVRGLFRWNVRDMARRLLR